MIKERVIVYREEGFFIAQCLEQDICVQAQSMENLFARLGLTFGLEENLVNSGPAPQTILDKWPERAQIASLTAENERLREAMHFVLSWAAPIAGDGSNLTEYEIWEELHSIKLARAALQPKEGEG